MANSNTWAIKVRDLSYKYTDELVLENISFEIKPNNLCALVGPNGSGKSTLIRCIAGLSKPNAGKAEVFCGHENKHHNIGYVPQRLFVSNQFPVSVYETVGTGRVIGQNRWF